MEWRGWLISAAVAGAAMMAGVTAEASVTYTYDVPVTVTGVDPTPYGYSGLFGSVNFPTTTLHVGDQIIVDALFPFTFWREAESYDYEEGHAVYDTWVKNNGVLDVVSFGPPGPGSIDPETISGLTTQFFLVGDKPNETYTVSGFNFWASVVPEPATWLLMLLGLGLLGAALRARGALIGSRDKAAPKAT